MAKINNRPAGNGFARLALIIAIVSVYLTLVYGSMEYAAMGIVLHLWCLGLHERAQYRYLTRRISSTRDTTQKITEKMHPRHPEKSRDSQKLLIREIESLDGISLPRKTEHLENLKMK